MKHWLLLLGVLDVAETWTPERWLGCIFESVILRCRRSLH
jgi:hypothetical protein